MSGHRVAYDVLVGLHVVSGLVGFASVAISGVYGGSAHRAGQVAAGPGAAGQEAAGDTSAEELQRYFRSRGWLELSLLAVPVFGVLAIVVGPGPHALGHLWVLLGFGLWVLAAALLLGVIRPAEARLRAATGPRPEYQPEPQTEYQTGPQPEPQTDLPAVLSRSGRALSWAAATCDVTFVVALVVMVIQPRV